MKAFRCPEIAQLAHELSLSPVRQRVRQVAGASRAMSLIDATQEYPYSFVCFQVTGYRPRRTEDTMLSGKAVLSDLSQLTEGLTASSPLPATTADRRVYDGDALARRFKVSKKTISRWRARGLAGCWYMFEDGKARMAFTDRSVQVFVAANRDLVRRGASFQLMSTDEKARIIARARELVATGHESLHAVTLRLAEETGRAVETLRYTLRRFDREHFEQALFDRAERAQPIDEQTVIREAHAAGDSIGTLASRFGKRQAEIRRILTVGRAAELADKPIPYIYNESFDAVDAEPCILTEAASHGDAAPEPQDVKLDRVPASVPAYLRDLYRTSLLSREDESRLFRRMNFLLHMAELRRQPLASNIDDATAGDIAEIDRLLEQAGETKNQIIQSNLRLVVSIAKRHLNGRRAANLFELVSDGNIALMRAVEKFDYARGFRFSTYASWAITRHYARTIPEELQHGDRYQTGHDEVLSFTGDRRIDEQTKEAGASDVREAVAGVLKSLDARERAIVQRHYGLANNGDRLTLDEIGREFGISKERVRQIEQRALRKLRSALGERGAELLAG